jgi:Rod binding domain-containing protein
MSDFAISSVLPGSTAIPAAASKAPDPAKAHDAAQQFEALLMGQIMRSARASSGWLGDDADPSAECATDYAEQQFAAVIAQHGGLGLAHMVAKGLERSQ